MIFAVTLKIMYPGLSIPIEHADRIDAISMSSALKKLDLSNIQICDLRNRGETMWIDEQGATHVLTIEHEAH